MHNFFPSILALQLEFGQYLQSEEEKQVGSGGGSQPISTSSPPVKEIVELMLPRSTLQNLIT
jgi:hypothetical protein